jgi:hypothetical protein
MRQHLFPLLMFLWGAIFGGVLVALICIYGG